MFAHPDLGLLPTDLLLVSPFNQPSWKPEGKRASAGGSLSVSGQRIGWRGGLRGKWGLSKTTVSMDLLWV